MSTGFRPSGLTRAPGSVRPQHQILPADPVVPPPAGKVGTVFPVTPAQWFGPGQVNVAHPNPAHSHDGPSGVPYDVWSSFGGI